MKSALCVRVAVLLMSYCLFDCSRVQQQQPVSDTSAVPQPVQIKPMIISLRPPRVLDTMFYADVFGAGVPKAFVFSIRRDTGNVLVNTSTNEAAKKKANTSSNLSSNDTSNKLSSLLPSYARFDLMQIYNWNIGDSSWNLAEVDSFAFGVAVGSYDVTRDGKPDIIVRTRTAPNGVQGAGGMTIWSAHSGEWKRIFNTRAGDPSLQYIDGDSLPEVVLHGHFSGVLPSTEAVEYVTDIYAFNGMEFAEAKSHYPKFFSDMSAQAEQKYAQAKTQTPVTTPITDEMNFTLYKPCLLVLAWFRTVGNTAGARAFWEKEKDYLSQMIPQEQYIDLDVFAKMN